MKTDINQRYDERVNFTVDVKCYIDHRYMTAKSKSTLFLNSERCGLEGKMSYFQLPLPGRCIDVVTVVMTLPNIYPADIYLFKVNNRNTRKRANILMSMASFWCFYS